MMKLNFILWQKYAYAALFYHRGLEMINPFDTLGNGINIRAVFSFTITNAIKLTNN